MSDNNPLADNPEPLLPASHLPPVGPFEPGQAQASPPGEEVGYLPPTTFHPDGPREPGWSNGLSEPAGRPKQLDRPHPGFWWACLWCLGFILVTQVFAALLGLLLALAIVVVEGLLAGEGNPFKAANFAQRFTHVAVQVAMFVAELAVVGVSWLVLRLVVGRDWPRRVALRRPGLTHLVLVLIGFPAMVLLANGAYEVLRKVLHVPSISDLGLPGMEEMVKQFATWPAAFAVLVIGLGPGIGEELWCRAFLGRGLVGRYGPIVGVLLTSFFFGLIHIDPAQGTMAVLMGLWLHYVYLTSRSLWLPMLLHFLNNSFAVLAPRIESLQQLDEAPGAISNWIFVGSALLLAAVGWALYQSRARLVPDAEEGLIPFRWQPAYPGVEYPPPESGTRVAHPWPSLVTVVLVLVALGAFVGCWFIS
jgi:membrane protease YdiL (CAAX protease family)